MSVLSCTFFESNVREALRRTSMSTTGVSAGSHRRQVFFHTISSLVVRMHTISLLVVLSRNARRQPQENQEDPVAFRIRGLGVHFWIFANLTGGDETLFSSVDINSERLKTTMGKNRLCQQCWENVPSLGDV